MDAEQQPTIGVNKSSGLPRPTKLPLPNSRASRLPLCRLQNQSEPPRPSKPTPSVQKRPSIPVFSQSKQPSILPAKPVPSKTNGAFAVPKSAANGTKKSMTGAQSFTRKAPHTAVDAPTASQIGRKDDEIEDQLSSLDSFRAASRQGSCDDTTPPLTEDNDVMEAAALPKARKQSRPSLSDRTIESLQNLPATPKDRRRSSFFSPIESPMRPPPRPASNLSWDGSNNGSRPSTSDGRSTQSSLRAPIAKAHLPQRASKAPRQSTGASKTTGVSSTQRCLSSAFHAQSQTAKTTPYQMGPSLSAADRGTNVARPNGSRVFRGSMTAAARSGKARPSLSDAFGSAVEGNLIKQETIRQNLQPERSVSILPTALDPDIAKKSSAALREQIAAARAAARSAKAKHDSPLIATTVNGEPSETEVHFDPFNQAPREEKHVLRNRIKAARTDGKLNIAAMRLIQIPDEVLSMYDAAAMEESRTSWAEVVDLTRFIAADNAIEALPETVFPDKSFEDFDLDDQSEGNQFGGLEMLDLDGNLLSSIPKGMRRLQRLTSLNLSHNKLDNTALDVICQIDTLKDLKLGHNNIAGSLSSSLCQLARLESLDLQSNRLLSLPEAMRELVSLKVLNVSGNQLTALPMDALQDLRLTELDASNNSLIASLFPMGPQSSHTTLQILNVSNNSLAALTFNESLKFPRLHTLNVSCNNLTRLPPASDWTELVTLLATDNKIRELPEGFTTLTKVKNVNLTSNELNQIDPEIGRMESLESLILASNPLRDRKFLTMNTADIKRDLLARLGLCEAPTAGFTSGISCLSSPAWTIKANSSLDLSSAGHKDDVSIELGRFLADNEVKRLHLQSNALTVFPSTLAFGRDLRLLDLSGNALRSEYLTSSINVSSLEDLNLSGCSITTLNPLTKHLQAPKLSSLNVAANRLSGALPSLRASFPSLTSLVASDNRIRSITADSLRGLQVVNLASNDIQSLPPEIGVLWNEGLHSLEVGRNAFRVPNYRVLEKGTEAIMKWLRNKLPAPESGENVEEMN